MADPNRFKFDADELLPQVARRDAARCWRELPEACDNTLLIAERCDMSFTEGERHVHAPVPLPAEGENEESWFVKEVETGPAPPLPRAASPTRCAGRPTYETEVITSKGFAGYFLVVADFINWAKEQRHPGRSRPWLGRRARCAPTRCGSPTSTRSQHGLIFERFLNPDRMSMPDFDIDFDERRRGEVIRYVTEKYGDDRVAQIVTYGTIKAKQAIKDAARVLGYPFAVGERITKAMPPPVMGKDIPLAGIFDPEHPRYKEGGEFRAAATRPTPTSPRSSTPRAGWRA